MIVVPKGKLRGHAYFLTLATRVEPFPWWLAILLVGGLAVAAVYR